MSIVKQSDIDLATKINVPVAASILLSPIQQGWMALCHNRIELGSVLTNNELEVQKFLNDIKSDKDLPSVQNKLKSGKEAAAIGKDARLQFTRRLDEKLINPLMEFEKRNELLVAVAAGHELDLRTAAHTAANAATDKQRETALYKAHIENEQQRIAVEYRNTLSRRVNFYYTGALESKMEVVKINDYKADIAAELPMIELPKAVKYETKLMTVDEKKAIIEAAIIYDGKADLQTAIESIETVFAMYAQDLKNVVAALAKAKELQAEKEASAAENLVIDAEINKLAATANVGVIASGVKVKKSYKIIEHENESFMLLIITNFLKKYETVKRYVKVKSVMKLSIQQMTDALSKHITETGEQLVGLNVEEIIK